MLRIEGPTRRYGSKAAVENVSLDIESGKFIGVIGRSGAGKSTLLRMINRLETPTSGIALALSALDQLDIASLADRARLGRDDLRANMGALAPSREADRQADSDFHYGR